MCTPLRSRPDRSGFTLVEIVVAVGLLAIIATIAFMSITASVNAQAILEEEDATNQAARVAISTLRRDFSMAWLTPNVTAINTYRTLFVGQNGDPDRAWFASISHHRKIRNSRECDQTEITLWLEDDPETEGTYVLLRREAPRIDQEPERDGVIYPLAYRVKSFDLRYLVSETAEWVEDWDSTGAERANQLPRAVQVVLVLMGPDPEDDDEMSPRSYVTTVPLFFGKALTKEAMASQ